MKTFLDIVAIASISEKVPLVDENKSIVKYGLKLINKTQRCAIKSLIAGLEEQEKISSYGIFEKIANKIDIAVKVCNPRIVVELFTTCDYYKALQIVKYIEHENRNYLKVQFHDGIYEEINTNYDLCRCF
ncbi:hypothetical protein Q428_00985 [Fervidicella metallireducens AeB]|uniref:Uncharacterized protein n=1 Tax=Fervidicella metallireducens AeB TaxID=1403537 RepID=A0A017RY60_9CLOT|nr:DHH family phosphoesterase [Fervidicella metallireducens]EYE89713.1 hypothetical protein Q428_00985 [Fervidicella metallireducens AeB]